MRCIIAGKIGLVRAKVIALAEKSQTMEWKT